MIYIKKNKLKRFLKSCSICVNLCLITLVLITFTVLNSFAEDRGKKEFWLNKYGEIKEDMHSIRAYKVFNRVLDAADRRTGVEPALYIINFDGLPWAQSLADGSIILTKNGLEFFYKDQGTEKGDARLAFVLGHELAHQFKGDFWHYYFFRSLGEHEDNRFAFQEIKKIARNPDMLIAKELKADQYGIIYAVLAGYRTDEIVSKDKNFFLEWAKAMSPSKVYTGNTYPSPEKRAAVTMLRLKEISEKTSLFYFGIISYHLGWHDEALSLLKRFSHYYPGREVYTNIGTVYLKMAYEKYLSSRSWLSFPFELSFGPDVKTRAESIDISRSFSEGIFHEYKKYAKNAIDNFNKAIGCDPFYPEAKNSLGCTYIMEEKYYDAVSILEDALALNINDGRIQNNLAVAYFLLGQKIESTELKSKAEEMLNLAMDKNRAASNNLATLYRIEGKKGDYLASMDYMIELPVKPQNNHPLSKRLKPGTEAALNGDYKIVDETMTKDKNRLRILELTDEKVIVLQKDKIIRLVAYKEPDNMQINTKGGDSREVTISKERRSGTISLGERILYYFEF